MKQLKRLKTASGSVLLTVVMVMFIMVMFLMSTLVLTNSANRRSYYTYFQTQAQYAAQAALDAVTNRAYNDSNFNTFVQGVNVNETKTFKVYFDNTDLPLSQEEDGKKYVECAVTRLSDKDNTTEKSYVWDEKTATLRDQDSWIIAATAYVGTGRNTAKETIENMVYGKKVDDAGMTADTDWELTFIKGVDLREEGTPATEGWDEPVSGTPKILPGTDSGYRIIAASTNDNMDSMGASYHGAYEFPKGRTKYPHDAKYTTDLNNDTGVTGGFVGINYIKKTGYSANIFINKGSGVTMVGDLFVENNGYAISSNSAPGDGPNEISQYKDLPYFYIDGQFLGQGLYVGYASGDLWKDSKDENKQKYTDEEGNYYEGGKLYEPHVGHNPNNAKASTTNLYAGSVQMLNHANRFSLNGDAYLFETAEGEAGRTYLIPSNGNESKFASFVEANIKKTGHSKAGIVGGDIVSNNRVFELEVASDVLKLGGDLVLTNPAGTFKLNENKQFTINGSLVVRGKMQLKSDTNIVVNGGAYFDKNFSVSGGALSINGTVVANNGKINYDALATANAGTKVLFDGEEKTQSATEVWIESLNIHATGSDMAGTCANIMTARPDYPAEYDTYAASNPNQDYGLFPFYQRLDEIWEEYVRWDLGEFESEQGAKNKIANGKDYLMKESEAAGHTYNAVKKYRYYMDGETPKKEEKWFIATTPIGNNWFIPKLSAYDPELNDASDTDAAKLDLVYYDNFQDFAKNNGGTEKNGVWTMTELKDTETDYDANASVAIFGHDKAGNEYTDKLTCDVITESGILYVESNKNYFIDPTRASNNELSIVLRTKDNQPVSNSMIIVNNSATYPTKDYTKPFPFGSIGDYSNNAEGTAKNADEAFTNEEMQKEIPSRASVKFFVDEGFNVPTEGGGGRNGQKPFDVIPSGAYYQIEKMNMAYLVNAPFPDGNDKDAWNNEKVEDKFLFEMVPNFITYACKTPYEVEVGDQWYSQIRTYNSLELGFGTWWGAFVAPTTVISKSGNGPSDFTARIEYRVNKNDEPIIFNESNTPQNTQSPQRAIFGVGSLLAKSTNFTNGRMIVNAGPVVISSTPGGSIHHDGNPGTNDSWFAGNDDGSNGGSSATQNGGPFFGNDHMQQG